MEREAKAGNAGTNDANRPPKVGWDWTGAHDLVVLSFDDKMVRLSNQMTKSSASTKDLIAAISAAVMRWQDATQRYDEAVGARLDLSTSERQCLACLVHGARPARDIARATHLTRAAVTTLVDRLERRGLVRRAADAEDRRQVLVSMTAKAKRLTGQFYAAIAAEGAGLLARYSREELATVLDFIEAAVALQEKYMGLLERGE